MTYVTIETATRTPGRPRNEETVVRVLASARALVVARGFPAVTMNMIASDAGVAKQTLYRRWPGKAEIILDAFLASAGHADSPAYDGLETTLYRFLSGIFTHLAQDGAAIRSLIASAQSDPEFLANLRNRFARPRGDALMHILSQAVTQRDLPEHADIHLLCDMIHGAFWYRLLLGEPLDDAFALRLSRAPRLTTPG